MPIEVVNKLKDLSIFLVPIALFFTLFFIIEMQRRSPFRIFSFMSRPLSGFLQSESASGLLLGTSTLLALIIANSRWSKVYFDSLNQYLLGLSLQHWINDGLMTIFFFSIGMEIKKEIVGGELSNFRKAALPVAAAMGGMIVPAIIYLIFNFNSSESSGWGIPMATDIAFALGVLNLFGSRVPSSLKVFLLALAIVDDLGAVLVIAFFYTKKIHTIGLLGATLAFLSIFAAKQFGIRSSLCYFVLGIAAWLGFLYSGVHATLAGVLLGLMMPLKFKNKSPLEELLHKLNPLVNFGVMPLFAFANAGIFLGGLEISKVIGHPIHQGIALGLFVGKPIGIFGFCLLAVILKIATLPSQIRWIHILGAACLGGVGFTMALFISTLALPIDSEMYSKTGIILGSVGAAILGSLVLRFALWRDKKYLS